MLFAVEPPKALGEIGDLSAIEPLVKMLQQYEDPFVRKETVVALGQIGGLRVFKYSLTCSKPQVKKNRCTFLPGMILCIVRIL